MGNVGLLAGLTAIAGGSARLLRARARPTDATRYVCAAVIAAGFSAALSAPLVLAAAARIEPHPNLTRLVANSVGMFAAWCVQSSLVHLVTADCGEARRAVRTQGAVLLAALASMWVLFLASELSYRPDFLNSFADQPTMYGYLLVFGGYIGWSMVRFTQLIHSYAGLTDRRWLHLGLRTMQAGAVLGVAWAAHKIVAATTLFSTGSSYPGSEVLASALPAGCVALITIGLCTPLCAPPLARLALALRRHRQYRALRGLWSTLSPVIAEVRPAEAPTRSVHERLSSRVVDILDALLVLAPYRLDGATVHCEQAWREAAAIASALTRWQTGVEPEQTPAPPPVRTMDDLDSEVARLRRVAHALRRLPAPTSDHTP